MMKQNQKLLLLCGDSYQDISLLAAVNEAQKLNAKNGNALVLYLGEGNAITQEATDMVVVSKLKLDALRTTLLSYTGSRLLLAFADKQILNLLFRLEETGFFKEASIMIVGPSLQRYRTFYQQADQRRLFQELGYQVPASALVGSVREAIEFSEGIQFPIMIWPVASKQGQGRKIAHNLDDLCEAVEMGLSVSPSQQCLLEFSTYGFKELDFVVIRDREDNHYLAASIESIDPVGIHSSDSYQFMPAVTLTDREFQNLREAAIHISRYLKLTGAISIKFALDPTSYAFYILEVNPFASDSISMASMGLGYSLFEQGVQLQLGRSLEHLPHPLLKDLKAVYEPSLDYIFFKIPIFSDAAKNARLNTQIHSYGAVYGFGKRIDEAYQHALETIKDKNLLTILPEEMSDDELIQKIARHMPHRLFYILEALKRGFEFEELLDLSKLAPVYLQVLANLVAMEKAAEVATSPAFLPVEPSAGLYEVKAGASYYLTQNGTNESLALEAACVLVDDLEIRDERFYQKVRKQAKELKEKGQQVILLTNRPFTESLADKVYYLPINETSLHLIQTIDQVKDIVKLSNLQ
ncbi:ATP-binding protein [Streptococcus parasanguinis]|uniref:carbamoyl-phosphate synthase (ammonia) n=1 Tax=Streptococcus parasanguinis (strain ATCC 15912 / DSM 6778 / CIP 104372 / LMG 14537) TaxID=760570 RepID=F8DHM2_STREP|nr:ATP-grasp domain-containing protein [Streptococcus parasanguinis]AEH55639.1 putative carbamoyl-phosphate synthetase, large subunit, oligomerization domain protein [Streptococcus parasanguinis ATCC 15912]